VVFLLMVLMAVGSMLGLTVGVVGLIEAPWPVLLALLGIAFYGLQRLDGSADASADPLTDGQSLPPTKAAADVPLADAVPADPPPTGAPPLTYRGIAYQPRQGSPQNKSPAQAPAPGKRIEGVYRGQKWQRVVGQDENSP